MKIEGLDAHLVNVGGSVTVPDASEKCSMAFSRVSSELGASLGQNAAIMAGLIPNGRGGMGRA
jgi:hypothetical protein